MGINQCQWYRAGPARASVGGCETGILDLVTSARKQGSAAYWFLDKAAAAAIPIVQWWAERRFNEWEIN